MLNGLVELEVFLSLEVNAANTINGVMPIQVITEMAEALEVRLISAVGADMVLCGCYSLVSEASSELRKINSQRLHQVWCGVKAQWSHTCW